MRCAVALLALGLLTAACGADTAIETGSDLAETGSVADPTVTTDVEATAQPAAALTPTAVPGATVTASATPVPPPPEAPALESNYGRAPIVGGWSVTAGEWISHSFSIPLFFNLPVDGTVINEGAGRVEIAVGDPLAPDGFITIVEPLAINSPTGPIPIDLADPAILFAPYDLRVETSTEVGARSLESYDVAFPPDPALSRFRSPCDRSPRYQCLTPFTTLSHLVFLEEEVVHRIVGQDWGDGRLFVIATSFGSDAASASFLEHGNEIAGSAIPVPQGAHDGSRWLTTVGDRVSVVPAGRYVGRVGDTTLTVTLDADMSDARVHAQRPTVLGMTSWVEEDWGSGQIRLFDFDHFIDAEGDLPSNEPRVDVMPSAEFEAGLRELLLIEETGSSLFGGVEAQWFDVSAAPGMGESCAAALGWPNPDATCVAWASMRNPYRILQPSDVTSRVYYLVTVDLVVVVTPEQGFVIDDVLSDLAAFVEGLQILAWPS